VTDRSALDALDAMIATFATPGGPSGGSPDSRNSPTPATVDMSHRGFGDRASLRARAHTRAYSLSTNRDLREEREERESGFAGDHQQKVRISADRDLLTRQMLWHLEHGERVPPELCAGCRKPIAATDAALDLADTNRVHLTGGYDCLTQHCERWRKAARAALAGAGR
jgi:hypothetical protein